MPKRKTSKNPFTTLGLFIFIYGVLITVLLLWILLKQYPKADNPTVVVNESEQHIVMGFPLPKKGEQLYAEAIIEIYLRESSCGTDPKARRGVIGLAGEQGDFQVTPIWCRDIKRLFNEEVDPYNNIKLWGQIKRWLMHYGPKVGAKTENDLCELFRRGPTGYEEWKNDRSKKR